MNLIIYKKYFNEADVDFTHTVSSHLQLGHKIYDLHRATSTNTRRQVIHK